MKLHMNIIYRQCSHALYYKAYLFCVMYDVMNAVMDELVSSLNWPTFLIYDVGELRISATCEIPLLIGLTVMYFLIG